MMRRAIALVLSLCTLVGLASSCGEDVDWIPPHADQAERFWVTSEEDAWAHIQRYAAEGPPVLLVHGISSNHHFWDLAPGRSLALDLHRRGMDVYNMDLRGHGFARRGPNGRKQKAGWSIDDYGAFDMASAIVEIQRRRPEQPVHVVGHSMGGMVLAIYLALTPQPPLASAVVVASPLDFRDPDAAMRRMLGSSWIAMLTGFTPTPMGARFLAGFGEKAPFHGDEWVLNPDNYTREAYTQTMRRVVSPLSRGEVAQFRQIGEDGEFRSENGGMVYRTSLGHVRVPMRFLAGRADHIVSPDRVRAYFEAVGSRDKDFIIAGREHGFAADYGHLDFGPSDHAEAEIYPLVADWIESHP